MLGQIQPEYCVYDLVGGGHCLHLYGGSWFETRCVYFQKDIGYFHHTQWYAYGEIDVMCKNMRYIEKTYNNLERRATVYLEPGIIKYQSNWGQQPEWNLDL